jgi:hypothetical protein
MGLACPGAAVIALETELCDMCTELEIGSSCMADMPLPIIWAARKDLYVVSQAWKMIFSSSIPEWKS